MNTNNDDILAPEGARLSDGHRYRAEPRGPGILVLREGANGFEFSSRIWPTDTSAAGITAACERWIAFWAKVAPKRQLAA